MFEFLEGEFGVRIIEFFQSGWLGSLLFYLLLPFHYLGSEMGYMLVLPLFYWSIDKKTGRQLFVLSMIGAITSTFFKIWWKRPRPFHVSPDTVNPIKQTIEYGLPSGHTIFGTVFGASIFRGTGKNWLRITALFFILTMGVSRMIHGMHFLQDVVVAWLTGLCLVIAYFKLEPSVVKVWGRINLPVKITFLTGLIMCFYACTLVYSESYQVRKELLSAFGALSGFLVSILIDESHIRFSNAHKLTIRIYRGFAGLLAMFFGVFLLEKAYYSIVHDCQNHWVLLLYLLRYMLVGLWIFAGIPFLFKKINLQ